MKRFFSPLIPVQKLSRYHERLAVFQLATAVQKMKGITDKINSIYFAHDDSVNQDIGNDFSAVYWKFRYRSLLLQQLPNLREQLSIAEQEVGQYRSEYRQAYQRNRTFQILIDKQKIAHRKKVADASESDIEDINRYLLYKK